MGSSNSTPYAFAFQKSFSFDSQSDILSSIQITKIFNVLAHSNSSRALSVGMMRDMEMVLSKEWNNKRIQWKKSRSEKYMPYQNILVNKLTALFSSPRLLDGINGRRKQIKLVLSIYLTLTLYMQRNVFFAFQAGSSVLETIESSAFWRRKTRSTSGDQWNKIFAVLYYLMGRMYSTGKGCETDDSRAVELYSKCLATKKDDPSEIVTVWNDMAIVRLACMYLHGCGCDKQPERAWRYAWYCIRQDLSHSARAFVLLGNILHDGVFPKRMSKGEAYGMAVKYYEESAERGCKYAYFNLASCWEEGHGVSEADPRKALELYQHAADLGHSSSSTSIRRLMRRMKHVTMLGNM